MAKKMISAALAVTALTTAAPASAASFVFSGSVKDNMLTTSAGGISVTAIALSAPTLASSPELAGLANFSEGLGVINRTEGNGSIRNSHTVDNIGGYDFIALQFSKAVNLTGMTLNAFSVDGGRTTDKDAWVSYGSFDGSASFASQWQGFLGRGFEVANNATLRTNAVGTTWLIGASRSDLTPDDGFKLRAVTAEAVAAVPEPATWMSMILGFGVVGGVMRRRTKMNFAIA